MIHDILIAHYGVSRPALWFSEIHQMMFFKPQILLIAYLLWVLASPPFHSGLSYRLALHANYSSEMFFGTATRSWRLLYRMYWQMILFTECRWSNDAGVEKLLSHVFIFMDADSEILWEEVFVKIARWSIFVSRIGFISVKVWEIFYVIFF